MVFFASLAVHKHGLMKRWKIFIALSIAMIFWALSFIWYKQAYEYFLPFTTIFLRFALSTVLLFLVSHFTGTLQRIRKQDLKFLLLQAFFNPFMYFLGESRGLLYVSSSISAVIISTIPLFVPVAAYFFYRERLSRMNRLGMFISFAGIVIIVMNHQLSISVPLKGLLFLMLAVCSAVAYSIVLKKMAMRYNAISVISWQNLVGTVLFMPLFLLFESSRFPAEAVTWKALLPVLELAVFASSVAFILYTYGVKNIGAARSSLFSNIIPVLTAFFAFLILGERLSSREGIGMVVVVTGLFLSQMKGRNHLPAEDEPSQAGY